MEAVSLQNQFVMSWKICLSEHTRT